MGLIQNDDLVFQIDVERLAHITDNEHIVRQGKHVSLGRILTTAIVRTGANLVTDLGQFFNVQNSRLMSARLSHFSDAYK